LDGDETGQIRLVHDRPEVLPIAGEEMGGGDGSGGSRAGTVQGVLL